jgi:hypothetical protein
MSSAAPALEWIFTTRASWFNRTLWLKDPLLAPYLPSLSTAAGVSPSATKST